MARWSINRRDLLRWAAASGVLAARPPSSGAQALKSEEVAPLRARLQGRVVAKDDTDFAALRESMAWNGRALHSRAPDAIVRAASVQDVSAAVKFARTHNLKVAVRGGGHNYHGAALRNGGLLIDLSGMNQIALNVAARRATVQAGRKGGELAFHLAKNGFAFPIGHCSEVPLSGYVLSGGLGWNVGAWGPACASVQGIEIVTADGEILHADAARHEELFWAARGAGPGFFAVATSFDVSLYDLPRAIRVYSAAFPLGAVPALAPWLDTALQRLHPSVEMIASYAPDPASGDVVVSISGFAFADSDAEARARLAPLSAWPNGLATLGDPLDMAVELQELLQITELGFPKDKRMGGDMRWSNASAGTLLSALLPLAGGAPPAPSAIAIVSFGGQQPPGFGASALSVGAAGFVGAYGFWDSAAEDAARREWLRAVMKAMEPLGAGSYVGEADLTTSADRVRDCFSSKAWTRLAALKKRYDPEDVFFSYLTEA